jgi:hypothetical protein
VNLPESKNHFSPLLQFFRFSSEKFCFVSSIIRPPFLKLFPLFQPQIEKGFSKKLISFNLQKKLDSKSFGKKTYFFS